MDVVGRQKELRIGTVKGVFRATGLSAPELVLAEAGGQFGCLLSRMPQIIFLKILLSM